MSYQVLARKWRPPDFDSLVGQDHVVTALRNALADGRIAQAYLFSGIRGVGKTTAARVLAKALNCLNGPDGGPAPDPCNDCDSCREINSGGTMDVLEVDAATYSKVEQVRELTETLRYAPARGRYKVVVLDEVHRLSRQAFDALLKIVEEPPPHLVFIFATTEIDAVPATILSRCQEFQFRRVASPVVAAHLRRICDAEEITASDAALRLIARAGEGSVRDSVALLDQMSTFGHGTISDDDAAQLLAGFDAALFGRLLGAILEGNALEVSAVAREVEANGWDPHHVFGQFLGFCRDGLHLAMGGDASGVDLPEEEANTLADLVRTRPGGYQGLLQILQLLLGSEATVRRSEFGGVALEIAWLRAAELPRVQQIEALLAGGVGDAGPAAPGRPGPRGGSGGSAPPGRGDSGRRSASTARPGRRATSGPSTGNPTSPSSSTAPEPSASNSPSARPSATSSSPRSASRQSASTQSVSTQSVSTHSVSTHSASTQSASPEPVIDLDSSRLCASKLGAVLELLPTSLAGLLRSARLGLRDGKMIIVPTESDRLVGSALSRKRNGASLEDALRKVYGPGVAWNVTDSAEGIDELVVERPEIAVPAREPNRTARRVPRRGPERSSNGSRTDAKNGSGGESDQPPVDLYDQGDPPRTAELDFSPPGDSPSGNRNRTNGNGARSPQNGRHGGRQNEPDPDVLAKVEGLPTVQLVQSLFRGKIRSVRDEIEGGEIEHSEVEHSEVEHSAAAH